MLTFLQTVTVDIYGNWVPYKWAWSKDIHPKVISDLTFAKALWEPIAFWTYENHWSVEGSTRATIKQLSVDVFWEPNDVIRGQLPKSVGDTFSDLLISRSGPKIKRILWWRRQWRPTTGWVAWGGIQGPFVDHVHIEYQTTITA